MRSEYVEARGWPACPEGTTYITLQGVQERPPGQADPCLEPCVRYIIVFDAVEIESGYWRLMMAQKDNVSGADLKTCIVGMSTAGTARDISRTVYNLCVCAC
jgi:hypothetical protein